MTIRFAQTAAAFALAAFSTFAPAQDEVIETEPPGRVGRVALTQGQVSISGDVGEAAQDALINWPVTTRNTITTALGARTEVRIGSTSVRLDGDSALEVTELDDDSLRLRLHYGSASIRVASSEVVSEFELTTPQARVRLREPGRLRVDAERQRDTSLVSVFDGEAQVDGAGASLTVRAGRSAEIRDDDLRTMQARRDAFDDWALARDRQEASSRAARYVGTEMTGYEDLDRYGNWTSDAEYGSLWLPTVASGWAPYRDGRWTWIAPWGWTWVDNAPWGYAPFHYGRWVYVKQRWAWAPGRHQRRPVWAPALVGWVGGGNWSVHFHSRALPAQGWYPLGPHDRYIPGYHLSDERLRRLHNYGWRDRHDRRDRRDRRDRDGDGRPDYRREGLTVVPHAQFAKPGPVMVTNLPKANSAPLVAPPAATAPPPPMGVREREPQRLNALRDRLDRIDRQDRNQSNPAVVEREREERAVERERERERWSRRERDDNDRFSREQRPPVIATHPNPLAPNMAQPARPQWQRPEREHFEERRQRPQPQPITTMPAPVAHVSPPPPQPAPQPRPLMPPPQQQMAPPPPQAIAPPPRANPVPHAPPPASQGARFKAEQRALGGGVREQER